MATSPEGDREPPSSALARPRRGGVSRSSFGYRKGGYKGSHLKNSQARVNGFLADPRLIPRASGDAPASTPATAFGRFARPALVTRK